MLDRRGAIGAAAAFPAAALTAELEADVVTLVLVGSLTSPR